MVSVDSLRAVGFPEQVIQAVSALTHNPSESYVEYIRKVARHPIAVVVKRADIACNNLRFDDGILPEDAARMRAKWATALSILDGAV